MKQSFFGGIDVGSCTTKGVLIDQAGKLLGSEVIYSATDFTAASEKVWTICLQKAGIPSDAVSSVISCGYGRKSVPFASDSLTEISCHGKGCLHHVPGPITVVDIGGQDNKIIKLDSRGIRVSFKMNRKCAAGTGAFLEEMALRLRVPLEEMNALAEQADGEVVLGSYCTVFSGTEVLEKIKKGEKLDRIVRGLFHSVVKRILEMDTLTDTVVLSGGVIAHHRFLSELIRQHVKIPVKIPPQPQLMGALGAALYAAERSTLEH
jgi:predicted CoA-substrate-specific enzyme activase